MAAAAGSAAVTSALVNRSRSRSQRKQAPEIADEAPEPAPLGGSTSTPPLGESPATSAAPPAPRGAELLVHDPAPAGPPDAPRAAGDPGRARSDDLARAIEAAEKVEASGPTGWARAASELRTQTTAADTGWAPSAAALAGSGESHVPAGAPATATGAEPAVADRPGAPDAPAVAGSPAWDYGLSGVDTRVPRLPGQEDRRRPRRRHRRGHDELDALAATGGSATAPESAAPEARSNGADRATVTPGAPPVPPGGDRRRRRTRRRSDGGERASEPAAGGAAAGGTAEIGEVGDGAGAGQPATGGTGEATKTGEVTPDRRLLLFIGIAVTIAVLLGLGVVVLGGGGDDSPEPAAAPTAGDADGATGTQPTATTPVAQLTPGQAFLQAGQRLQAAGTFSYQGTSSASDVSPVRPGPWLAVDLAVEGHVQLPTSRLFERGTADDGQVIETVTDGTTIWSRSAPSLDAVAPLSLQTLYTLPDPTPAKVGAGLLPQWFTAATGAVDAGPDSLGRRTFRATLPASVLGVIEDNKDPVDAVMVLALDQAGNPAHVEISTGQAGPLLRLAYDIVGIGDDLSIEVPGDVQAAGTGTGGSQSPQSTTTP